MYCVLILVHVHMIKILKTSIISPLSISISLSAANVLYTVAFLVKSQVWWLFFEFFPWLLCHRKSTVFTSRRNIVSDGVFLTDDGKLLHVRVEATGKARSPSVERLVDGTTRMAESAERRRRRLSTFGLTIGHNIWKSSTFSTYNSQQYTTPLSTLISSTFLNYHLYADDTQLFFSFHPSEFYSNITHLQNVM